ncbi:tetratricopeptide repeat protein [Thiomicrorhabdus sp. Milos-T2]|uniref:tetratricopeptide repeat protein n=1 Tax=Thiomicrorhabdus sp. Milos-T2 TaxID=90814 RepID=UPI00049433E6|nr:tetratricopeptide repeat protein [Thiomicrorhabdus sp. Milos-T2]
MKKLTLVLYITLFLAPIVSHAQTAFNTNTCNRIFKDDTKETCLKAVNGDANSRYDMARLFANPNNDKQNLKYAFYWHLKLSRQVLKEALHQPLFMQILYNTAVLYNEGQGVKQNLKKGFYWFTKAAELGEPNAMFRLAMAYESGVGTNIDDNKSLFWLHKAIEHENSKALIAMAKRLIEGKGVEQSLPKALNHLKQAAQQKDPEASFILGNAYLTGTLVKRDLSLAKEWYAQSCQQNLLSACKRYYDIDSQNPKLFKFLNQSQLTDDKPTVNQ